MGYRKIGILAAAFTIGTWAGVCATGDELVSKESLSKEPFGDLQPFDLSKRSAANSKTDAKEKVSNNTKAASQPDSKNAPARKPEVVKENLQVNDLGDPERIVFEGVKVFTKDQLRLALACDLKYQAAARPSNAINDYLTTLENRLTQGYLHSGCPDATVSASRDSKRKTIVVHVNEGPRFRKGEILVTGSKVINQQAVRDFLTKPQRARPWTYLLGDKRLDIFAKEAKEEKESADGTNTNADDPDPVTIWKSGEPIDFRQIDNSQLERGSRFALAELGYADTPFQVELERDAKQGLANLHISISHDMPSTVIADIEVTGLKRDSREALLKYLKIKPGDALRGETLEHLHERLANSCRYWTHTIEVAAPPAPDRYSPQPQATNCKLILKLEEFAPTPPLGEPLSAVDEAMKKCAAWLNSLTKDFGSRDLVVTTAAADLSGLLQHAQFILAPDGTTALDLQMATGDWRVDHSAVVGPHGVELYDWKHNDKFCDSHELFPNAKMTVGAKHAEDGEQQSRMMFGYAFGTSEKAASSARFPIEIRVEPVALLRLFHTTPTKTESRDGTLTLKQDEFELQVDESTGAIQSLKCAGFLTAGISAIDFRSKPGSAARAIEKIHRRGNDCQNVFDKKNPLSSAITYAIQQMERQPFAQNAPELRAAWRMAGKVSKSEAFRRLTNSGDLVIFAADSATNTFEIPGRRAFSAENWEESFDDYVPLLVDKVFPRGSWPWTVLREIFLRGDHDGMDSETNYAQSNREYDRMNAAHEGGPICGLVLTGFWQKIYTQNSKVVVRSASQGLHDMSDGAFLRDIRWLTDGDEGLAVLSRSFVEACGKMSPEDEDDMLKLLPPEYHGAFKGLVARRKTRPDEPPDDAIKSVMLDEWHKSWKGEVETRLHAVIEASNHLQTDVPLTK